MLDDKGIGQHMFKPQNSIDGLFENNKNWASKVREKDPQYFERLSKQQNPDYLWIGCSDSRVPANQIVGLPPGEIFVHRNIANLVNHTDLNALSVIQFAVDVLKVKHIMVVGHYGCSGVSAAINDRTIGISDNWIRHVKDIRDKFSDHLNSISCSDKRFDRLCELNVRVQAFNVCKTNIVRDAWERGQPLTVHGWIYRINDGLLKSLEISISSESDLAIAEATPPFLTSQSGIER